MADFKDIMSIKPTLQNSGSVQEQADLIKKSFPDKYDVYDEDGKLIIVDKASGEEAEGPAMLKTGGDYYSPEAIADRQATAESKLIPSPSDLVKALPGQEKALPYLPMIGAGIGTALLPEAAPWWAYLLAGGAGAGVGKASENKLEDKDLGEGVAKETAIGAAGGTLAKPIGMAVKAAGEFVAPKLAEKIPSLARTLYKAEPEAVTMLGEKGFSNVLKNNVDDFLEAGEKFDLGPKAFEVFHKLRNMSPKAFSKANVEQMANQIQASWGKKLTTEQIDWLNNFSGTLTDLQSSLQNAMSGQGLQGGLSGALQGISGSLSNSLSKALINEGLEATRKATRRLGEDFRGVSAPVGGTAKVD